MDPIRQALELARAGNPALQGNSPDPFSALPGAEHAKFREVKLNAQHLESTRIVAYNPLHEHGRYFDMLRTQVLQAMDQNGWQMLAITSPTAGCGKSVTACNLAMSIARLPERSVVLVDLDLQKPKVAEYLGIESKAGLLSVLEGRADLMSRIVEVSIGQNRMLVLPGEVCKSGSAEWMASQTMTTLLQTLKRDFRSHVIILDMPPMSGRRRRDIDFASDRIGLAGRRRRSFDLVRYQGVQQTSQIHAGRPDLGQQNHRENRGVLRLLLSRARGAEFPGRLRFARDKLKVRGHELGNPRSRHEVFGDIEGLAAAGILSGARLRNFPAHDSEQTFFLRIENAGSGVAGPRDIADHGAEPSRAKRKPNRGHDTRMNRLFRDHGDDILTWPRRRLTQ